MMTIFTGSGTLLANAYINQRIDFWGKKKEDRHSLMPSGANGKHISIKCFQTKGRKVRQSIPSQLANARYCNL